eukprot:365870-Rhodomonas_salina.3
MYPGMPTQAPTFRLQTWRVVPEPRVPGYPGTRVPGYRDVRQKDLPQKGPSPPKRPRNSYQNFRILDAAPMC